MKTYPVLTKEGVRSAAFEVENAYVGPKSITRLLAKVQGVTDIQRTKMFAKSGDIHVRFEYRGQAWIVWEPYGDNSRYWIGPQDGAKAAADVTEIEDAFKHYRPSFHRLLLGDMLTLRFITRFTKHD